PALGAGTRKGVEVRVLSSAPRLMIKNGRLSGRPHLRLATFDHRIWNHNSAVECFVHIEEVGGSNPPGSTRITQNQQLSRLPPSYEVAPYRMIGRVCTDPPSKKHSKECFFVTYDLIF